MSAGLTLTENPDKSPHDSLKLIQAILQRIQQCTIAVFGDFCVDAYWDLRDGETELSVETGLPVQRVRAQRYYLGGAGSVVANLAAMGVASVRPVGVIGSDLFGQKLHTLLAECSANTEGLLFDDSWQTMVYAKPYLGEQEQSRIDFGAFNHVSVGLQIALLGALRKAAQESDAVILNQQVPGGVSSPQLIDQINEIIHDHPGTLFLVDARHHPEKYQGAGLKLNMSEAARLLGEDAGELAAESCARDFAMRIYRQVSRPVFLTRGEFGLAVAADEEVTLIPGLQIMERTDSVGAGDAVVAALAASLAVNASPVEAATFGNLAAMITVRKLRMTGTASAGEILAASREPNYVFRPELAESPRSAKYLTGTEIEIVDDLPDRLDIRHCIFDHDGTLSTLREGWEQIMEPMMMRAILGAYHDTVDQATFTRIYEIVRQFIDRTTGIQTLAQMKGLADLVRQCGFVAESEVLDEHGYKHIYNVALLDAVNKRVEKLRRGELQSTDFQIKNAALLLKELHQRGVKLYLASGTDEADVITEAEAMGYAHFFEGRIFGAVGDLNVESKKVVLERIIREHNLFGHHFATFGDGPVEMRETERRGGLCVGLASDELRRFGLNISKRKRLIRAGADLIIPDYGQLKSLLDVLQLAGNA
jgi:rfaE bifunctional protein kinase chain/domain